MNKESAAKRSARPELTKSKLGDMYLKMLYTRNFEEKVSYFFSRAMIHGTTHLYVGEEAVAIGAIANLDDKDYITSTHRGHGHAIAKGMDINTMMAELLGKRNGYCKGKGGSMHIADLTKGHLGANGIVGGGIPIATGAALSVKLLGEDRVVVCFFGDGAMNEGTFHESVNLASVWKLPIIFICENNQYGMSTSVKRSTSVEDLSDRAKAYGIPGKRVDGMDVFAVYDAVKEAKEYVKKNGPALIVAQTYRYLGHSKSDANKYRTKEEIAQWREKDPIPALRKYLSGSKTFTEEELTQLDAKGKEDIEKAVAYAQACPEPTLDDLLTDVYSD
jgi:acetoin:2,6-dichlorophenolindophenol oxidoreductase subunit alpha